jgi:hypothetical protein
MTVSKQQIFTFVILIFTVISLILPVSAQTRILNSPVNKTTEINKEFLSTETRIATEKAVYAVGETVGISGSDFNKFETVSLSVERVNEYQKTNDLMAFWTVTADENGNITGEWFMPFEGNYVVKATGNESGVETQVMIASVQPILIAGNPS